MDDVKHNKLTRFMETTGLNAPEATSFLEAHNWDIDTAASLYFADDLAAESSALTHSVPEDYTGPRTLDGRPVPQSEFQSSSMSAKKATQPAKSCRRTGLATFSSLASQDRDDDSDEEDARRERRNLFAGGEKSGLAVQDPNRPSEKDETNELLRGIWNKARAEGNRIREEATTRPTNRFTGPARTLDGDGIEGETIDYASVLDIRNAYPAQREPEEEMEIANREIHLWNDGFSVGAGPLHPFSNPANQEILRMIHGGHAPLNLLNIRNGQQVNVTVVPHQEDWRQLPKPKEAFSGQGYRLGAPVPGVASTSTSTATPTPAPIPAAPSASTPTTNYNPDEPSVAIRVQMTSGARLNARFNLTQTVGDIYNFVAASDSSLASRPHIIATTFPNKNYEDKSAKLGDLAEFKKGGVAVVKWL